MNCQRLMLFSLILIMFLVSVACGETPSDEVEAGPTELVSPEAADQSTEADKVISEAEPTEPVSEVESVAEPEQVISDAKPAEPVDELETAAESEVSVEAGAEADQTAAQPAETETITIEGDRRVEPGRGSIIADTGFRPEVNGFSFPNFGADVNSEDELTGLLVWDAFGDVVCSRIEDDVCEPTPAAQLWVNVVDRARAGGHCEGLAALSAELFVGKFSPQEDFGVSTASELKRSDTLEDISFEWMTQAIEPVASETAKFRQMTPTEILDVLTTAMNDGSDFFTMGLYGPNGGHSVTPYKIEDLGNGIFLVYVYDSNYPGAEKFIEIDASQDTWRYAGAALNPADDPEPWVGGRGSMDLTSTQIRFDSFEFFECPFCGRSGDSLENKILVLLNGKGGRVSAVNGKNKRVAMGAGNSEVNEIPGSTVVRLKGNSLYDDDRNWLMILPADAYTMTVTGETNQTVEPAQVAIFQPGRSYVVDDINLDPGQEDQFILTDDGQFSYTAGDDEAPTLELGTDELDDLDGLYRISGVELNEGYSFTMGLDDETNHFAFFEDDPELETFDLEGYTVNAEGLQNQFSFDDVVTGTDDWAMFELEDDGDFLSLGLDDDSDGEVDIADTDGDGILDTSEPDTDGDGVIDDLEECDYLPDNEIPDCDDSSLDSGDAGSDEEGSNTDEDDIAADEESNPDGGGNIDDQGIDESDAGDDDGSDDNSGGDEDF